jgi:hypothetical protein
MPEDVECQRFFAFSKRVPKDVKRYCGICRQHGLLLETRGHVCAYKDCVCSKCELVRTRRQVMSQQIRLRREQDKRFQRTTEPTEADVIPMKETNALHTIEDGTNMQELLLDVKNMCYFCQKCKNHEILVWKKHHKKACPFSDCHCEHCDLIETRRKLDQHIKSRKRSGSHELPESPDAKSQELMETKTPPSCVGKSPSNSPALVQSVSPSTTHPTTKVQTICIPILVPVTQFSKSEMCNPTNASVEAEQMCCATMPSVSCVGQSASTQQPNEAFPSTASFAFAEYSSLSNGRATDYLLNMCQENISNSPILQQNSPTTTQQMWEMSSDSSADNNFPFMAATTNSSVPSVPTSCAASMASILDPLLQQLLRNPCPNLASHQEAQQIRSYRELEQFLASQYQNVISQGSPLEMLNSNLLLSLPRSVLQ